jgi:hypothetical protein
MHCLLLLSLTLGQDALTTSWLVTPNARPFSPGVHRVETTEDTVIIHSAGLTVHSFGRVEANEFDTSSGLRSFAIRIRRHPKPATDRPPTGRGIIGILVNGMPLYSPASKQSYQDRNLWHYDAIQRSPLGATQLLKQLLENDQVHSPILGYALDGYPIYGPYGWDGIGRVRRMRSSYRPLSSKIRDRWPDQTVLAPHQWGPPREEIQFVEDHEYVEGLGDLDASNARFASTPEYPEGTWAYFLTMDEEKQLVYPYTVGPYFRGELNHPPSGLYFDPRLKDGRRPLYLETRHEKPLHLLVVSADLEDFAHIHPEPHPGGGYVAQHKFAKAGQYHLYLDYSLPGEGPQVEHRKLEITAPTAGLPPKQSAVDFIAHGLDTLETGRDLPIRIALRDQQNKQPIRDLQPYLGAWAHFVVISEDGEEFIHAHPSEEVENGAVESHEHSTPPGPNPLELATTLGFRKPGRYKLWVQVQRSGEVITQEFPIEVRGRTQQTKRREIDVRNGTTILVTQRGYEPSTIEVEAGKRTTLSFVRTDAQNCGATLVIPALNLRRPLTIGKPERIEFTPEKSGALHFSCGMGMYRGAILVR